MPRDSNGKDVKQKFSILLNVLTLFTGDINISGEVRRSTDLSSNLRRRQRIYDQDQSFFINTNKTKSKSNSFKHFAKSTLAQGAQIQLKILVTPLTVPAMLLERRLGYETEERRLHAHACRLRPQRTSLVWSGNTDIYIDRT